MSFQNLKEYPASQLTLIEVAWVQIGTSGVMNLKEGIAPIATAGYGKLYVKTSDKKLYFKDSSGVEVTYLTGDIVEVNDATTGNVIYNLPSGVGIGEQAYTIVKSDASVNLVRIVPYGTETIMGDANLELSDQWASARLVFKTSNWVLS